MSGEVSFERSFLLPRKQTQEENLWLSFSKQQASHPNLSWFMCLKSSKSQTKKINKIKQKQGGEKWSEKTLIFYKTEISSLVWTCTAEFRFQVWEGACISCLTKLILDPVAVVDLNYKDCEAFHFYPHPNKASSALVVNGAECSSRTFFSLINKHFRYSGICFLQFSGKFLSLPHRLAYNNRLKK